MVATSLGDRALEAQACYSLGNTYTLLRQYERSVEYHMRHLHIARELNDRVGEARACWSLGNAYSALQRTDLALHYTTLHLDISRQVLFCYQLPYMHISRQFIFMSCEILIQPIKKILHFCHYM